LADDGRRGHEPGSRPETILFLIACGWPGQSRPGCGFASARSLLEKFTRKPLEKILIRGVLRDCAPEFLAVDRSAAVLQLESPGVALVAKCDLDSGFEPDRFREAVRHFPAVEPSLDLSRLLVCVAGWDDDLDPMRPFGADWFVQPPRYPPLEGGSTEGRRGQGHPVGGAYHERPEPLIGRKQPNIASCGRLLQIEGAKRVSGAQYV
jgi:hypothetical protein